MGETIGLVLAVLLVAGALAVLFAIVRFSIISPRRKRGARNRLHEPVFKAVEAEWDVHLPVALESVYATSLVECVDEDLVAPGTDQRRIWHVDQFIPLTVQDLSEWIKVSGVPGLPIAIDGDKGTYYLPFTSLKNGATTPILLRLPGAARQDVEVVSNVEEFIKFERRKIK